MTTVLCVGHVTRDRTTNGWRAGGGALYGALAFLRCGAARVRLLTKSADDERSLGGLDEAVRTGVELRVEPDDTTTTFRNVYSAAEERRQWVEARAEPMLPETLPPDWARPDVLFLSPVLQELELGPWLDAVERVPGQTVGLGAQGWFKVPDDDAAPDETGARPVATTTWAPRPETLEHVDVACMSLEDVASDPEAPARLTEGASVVALTCGAEGATIYADGSAFDTAATPARVVDPTGAGDVFAAALTWGVSQDMPIRDAARLAADVAAEVIQDTGVRALL